MLEAFHIPFVPNTLGQIHLELDASMANCKALQQVDFKLDTGSDFTTLSTKALKDLGYTWEQLVECKTHKGSANPAFGGEYPIQYLENVSLKFGDREIQHCRIFFSLGSNLRSLLGSDILKYFDYMVVTDYAAETGAVILQPREVPPPLSVGEVPIQIYAIDTQPTTETTFEQTAIATHQARNKP